MSEESQPEAIRRPAMEVDIACAGFGPAMGGFLSTLDGTRDRGVTVPVLRRKIATRMRNRRLSTRHSTVRRVPNDTQ